MDKGYRADKGCGMMNKLIEKIEALKKKDYTDKQKAIQFAFDGYNQAIDDVLAMPEIQAMDELVKELSDLWIITYPEDIFDGSSGDEGALKVVRIRELLKAV